MTTHSVPQSGRVSDNVLLSVRGLVTVFDTPAGLIRAVDDVSFDVHTGETVAIVGESGSGKSITSLSIMGLVPGPHGRVARGAIDYQRQDLLQLSSREMRKL